MFNCKFYRTFVIAFSLFYLLSYGYGFSQPIINSVSGTVAHKSTLIINGNNYGVKSPSAPLMWDDGEDRTVNTPSQVTDKGWDQKGPETQPYAYTDAYMQYRNSSFRSMTAPHSRSTKWLAGGHYQWCLSNGDQPGCTEDNTPRPYINGGQTQYDDVFVHVDSGTADKSHWWATWYYRADPNHPNHLVGTNDKMDVINKGATFYSGEGFLYSGFNSTRAPWSTDGNVVVGVAHHTGGSCQAVQPYGYEVANPKNSWVKWEKRFYSNSSGGQNEVKINGKISDYIANEAGCANWWNDTRSFTVGGYYRWEDNDTYTGNVANFRGGRNAYRYFDDIYIDTTFSRVMLCNHQTLLRDGTDVCEPQIPSSWSNTSIIATVNLGKLSANSTAYLFVFDANNNRNALGFPVIIGGGGDSPPSPPFLNP
jgi:hypothetical protein